MKNDFLKFYKERCRTNSISKLEDIANNRLIIDFHLKGIKGNDKIYDPIDEYNTENLMKNTDIVPGHIYSFIYKADKPSIYMNQDEIIEFTDKLPIVLVLKNDKGNIQGINLNLCSRDIRVIILNLVCNIDPDFFDKGAVEMIKRGQAPISKNILTLFANNSIIEYLTEFLKKLADIDYNIIFRTYKIAKIKLINRLELWLWKYVPFINYKDSVKQDILYKIWDLTGISKIKLN